MTAIFCAWLNFFEVHLIYIECTLIDCIMIKQFILLYYMVVGKNTTIKA